MRLVDKLSELTSLETSRLDKRINAASQGRVPKTSQVAKIKEFLKAGGVVVGSLSKNGIEEIIARTIPGSVEREVVELRRDAAKVSTAKLKKMSGAISAENRAHGLTQYYGATRTGRWAGRLIQIQNLPRPFKGYDQPHAIDLIFDPATDRETIEIVYGSTMSLASATLRGCFIAGPGKEFCIVDFSQIEARVVAWLSDQEDALQVFRDGKDIYVHTAASIGSNDRQLGKVLVLACGFGMGAAKFMATAETYGVELSAPQAENLVQGWRAANNHIVTTWYATSNAARNVIQNHVRDYWTPVGKLAFKMGKGKAAGALLMRLPNDRLLVYRDALVDYASNTHGEIFYSGVNQYTRQWSRQKTYGGKLIENAVQGIARDVMADAMLAMEARSFEIVGTIHDEIIVEADADRSMKVRDAMLEIMRVTPPWATSLPVGAAGFVARRYRK
jgi:DNA polymerase